LPRQACPECGTLIDVRIKKDGLIFFIHTGKKRSHEVPRGGVRGMIVCNGQDAEVIVTETCSLCGVVLDTRKGTFKGGYSESDE